MNHPMKSNVILTAEVLVFWYLLGYGVYGKMEFGNCFCMEIFTHGVYGKNVHKIIFFKED